MFGRKCLGTSSKSCENMNRRNIGTMSESPCISTSRNQWELFNRNRREPIIMPFASMESQTGYPPTDQLFRHVCHIFDKQRECLLLCARANARFPRRLNAGEQEPESIPGDRENEGFAVDEFLFFPPVPVLDRSEVPANPAPDFAFASAFLSGGVVLRLHFFLLLRGFLPMRATREGLTTGRRSRGERVPGAHSEPSGKKL